MLARILAHDYADAFAECEVFAGGAAACNALWSDSTNADERARILSARWAYSAGTSGGTLVVPVLVAALWPLPRAASLPPLQGVSDLDSAQTAMNVRALRATQDAPTTSYQSVILTARRNWIKPFRDGRDWKSYVAAHAMSSQVLPSKRAR